MPRWVVCALLQMLIVAFAVTLNYLYNIPTICNVVFAKVSIVGGIIMYVADRPLILLLCFALGVLVLSLVGVLTYSALVMFLTFMIAMLLTLIVKSTLW